MNHIFQTSVLIMKRVELNWLCKHIKKIRSSQPAIPVLNWVKHQSFLVSIVKRNAQFVQIDLWPFDVFQTKPLLKLEIIRQGYTVKLFFQIISWNTVSWDMKYFHETWNTFALVSNFHWVCFSSVKKILFIKKRYIF